jgi:1-acyl-sn-glycerol-3-phosphate acyltransferase
MKAFRHALGSRDFLKLWAGQVISGLGDRLDQMGIIALYAAAGYSSITSTMALIAVLMIAPQTLMSSGAGWLVDRLDRRAVMISSDLLRALIVITLPFTFARYGDTAIYTSILLIGLLTSFFTPAKSALIPRLVPDRALNAANALSSTTNIIATLVGSFIGGQLAHHLGVDRGASPVPFFLVDMATYFISAGLLWRIVTSTRPIPVAREPDRPRERVVSFLRQQPDILFMLVTASLFWALAAVAYSAINSFAYVRFGGGVTGVGNMQAALGLGMLLGAMAVGRRPFEPVSFSRQIWAPLAALGAVAAVLAASQWLYLAVIVVMLLGALGAVVLVAVDTGLQRLTPDGLRGRVFGLKEQATAAAFVVPSLAFYLDSHVDAHLTPILFMSSFLLLCVAAFFLVHGLFEVLERHQGADWGPRWLNRLDGLNRLLCKRFHRLEHDELPLPAQGPALLVANHVSGLDPLLMIAASPRPLRFMIAWDEYERWWLKWLFRAIGCIPVGGPYGHRRALLAAKRALEAGEIVALFPQGGIVADDSAPVRLKRGVVMIAEMTRVPIYPVRLEGVSGAGRKIGAVFVRSRARLRRCDPLEYREGEHESLLAELGRRLATVRSVTTPAVPANP